MRFVATHDGCRVKDVARGLGISHPAATKLVDRLVARGVVGRDSGVRDRREVSLSATPSGKQALSGIQVARSRVLAAILDRMDPGERAALKTGLGAFLRAALRTPEDVEAACGRCGNEHLPDCPVGAIYETLTGKPEPPA